MSIDVHHVNITSGGDDLFTVSLGLMDLVSFYNASGHDTIIWVSTAPTGRSVPPITDIEIRPHRDVLRRPTLTMCPRAVSG
jgi:hypothetical protein